MAFSYRSGERPELKARDPENAIDPELMEAQRPNQPPVGHPQIGGEK